MKYLLSASAVIALAVAFSHAQAEDPEADVITVSGLRPADPADVTASVSVLNQDQLKLRNAPFLADSLRAVPGLGVSRSGSLGGLTQIRIRGAEANHTLVLLDGIEISDPVTGETDFGLWSGLDITRIEVARGEQSALYGSDAIGGVIAITTGGEGVHGSVETGSRQTGRAQISGTHRGKKGYLGASLSGFTTEGVDTSGADGEEDGSSALAGALRGGIEFATGWQARGLARISRSTIENDSDTDFDGLLEDTLNETETEQVSAGVTVIGSAANIEHLFRLSYSEVIRENSDADVFTDRTTGERLKFSYSPSHSWSNGDWSHRLTGLIEHEDEEYQREDTNTFFGDPNQIQDFTSLGLAAEYQSGKGPLTFNASLRHDGNDGQFEDALTWRLGGAYRTENFGRFRISAGEGVKNPTFTELFGFFPGSFVGNPDLDPEHSRSIELGWDKRFANGQFSAAIFSATLEDEIFTAFNPDFTSTALNREGESERRGIELSGQYQVTDSIRLYASATTISSENDSGEDEIRVPEWTASLGGSWESAAKPGLVLTVALDKVSDQDDFDFGSFPARRVALDSYTLASATVSYPLTDRVALMLRGDNLFDERTRDVFGYAQPGAGLYAGLRFD